MNELSVKQQSLRYRRVDIEGQDWSLEYRFDGDYVRYQYAAEMIGDLRSSLNILLDAIQSSDLSSANEHLLLAIADAKQTLRDNLL